MEYNTYGIDVNGYILVSDDYGGNR